MEKLELLEDMKRKMLKTIERREVPDEVRRSIKKAYIELEQIIRRYNNKSNSAVEYMEGNLEYVEHMLSKVNEEKINNQADGIMYICRDMQRKTEENIEENGNKDKEHFTEAIINGNTRPTIKIVQELSDSIRDVLNKANRLLDAHGYPDRDIENQTYEIRQLINKIESRTSNKIQQELDNQDKKLLGTILEQYEEYQEQIKTIERREKDKEDDGESKDLDEIVEDIFRKSLQEGAPSQEEQKKNSEEFVRKQEEKKNEEKDEKKVLPLDPFII